MFAKISKKVVAVTLVTAMAVTTATVASDNTASAAIKMQVQAQNGLPAMIILLIARKHLVNQSKFSASKKVLLRLQQLLEAKNRHVK